ncbi:IS3 family transposase [Mesotoga prima]|uniref:IS3 family transposase n=1 Tax=Mesotoga prima TaxID=1184387 RepID=UPI002C01230F|nr:IS3 family transposase [Paludibacter sp.]
MVEHRHLLESTERGCQLMSLPRSTYYHLSKNHSGDDSELITQIEAIIEEFPGYGYRRVTCELHRRGIPVNHKKVLRIMRQRGLLRKTKRRWIKTTDSNHSQRIYPNRTENLVVTAPNQVWAADITYIGIRKGFVYLAVILDLFARRAIGYAISRNIDTALCLAALNMAIIHRKPPKGVIHHSDRGVQYASHDYIKALLQYGFLISMSRKGNPYDNATAESFFKTLKVEEIYLWEYRTLDDVQIRLPFFIQEVYNRKRLHSSLGYRPPVEFEELFFNNHKPWPTALTQSV